MTPRTIAPHVLSWASIIDDATAQQAIALSKLPFVTPHVALMPDAHFGLGSAVGTVIPTDGAVIPAAVGVDIGCVDADTEYLTPAGWKRIADYAEGDRVMQYSPETGVGGFAVPERYIVKEAGYFYHLTSKDGIDQMLTPDHKVIVWETEGRARARVPRVMLAEEYVQRDGELSQGYRAEFETSFALDPGHGTAVDEATVRVHVMTSAGTTISKGKATLHLAEERTIKRARELLAAAGIDCTIRPQTDGSTFIRYIPPLPHKSMDVFWQADADTLRIVADEVFHWDGSAKDEVFFTRNETEADVIQYALTTAGYRSSKHADIHPRDGMTDYRVSAIGTTKIGRGGDDRAPIATVPSADGKAYCFTMPSGFLVLRRNGNIFITGNCGMIAARTRYAARDLERTELTRLRDELERAIPLSPGNYNRKVHHDHTRQRVDELEKRATRDKVDLSHSPKWREQLGSLGGGNHFIELCLDEQDRVWCFLHSGSRGVGNKIARKHITIARGRSAKGDIRLADPDHAYLLEGTPEFDSYLRDLRWAQRFALLNREEMMDRFVSQLARMMGDDPEEIEVERVNTHHNYTEKINLYGSEVWLTRKGAIDATEGKAGLIPGSMGTRSYVTRGKGNEEALYSAPHGAGRAMSRNQAKKRFTAEDLDARMTGIVYRPGREWVDEIPDAYKPIDQVMEDAGDLVEVVHELRQVLNVKGT